MLRRFGPFGILCVSVIFSLVGGCASSSAMKRPASHDEGYREIVVTQDSITVHLFPYIDSALCGKYLGIKPSSAHMIPSLLRIENNSSKILKVNLNKCSFSIAGKACLPLEPEDAFDRAKRSGAEVVVWQLGFGIIGASMAANNVTSANRSLEEDFHSRYFKPTLINSGKTAQGIIFNQYPSGNSFHDCIFTLNMTDLSSPADMNVTITIPDSLLTLWRKK